MKKVQKHIFIGLLLSLNGCSTLWKVAEEEPAPVVVKTEKSQVRPQHRRKPGRLGPLGGRTAIEQQGFHYPEVPVVHHPEVDNFVRYYSQTRRSFIEEALSRRAKLLPIMEPIFKEYGLPTELVNLAFVESRFIPTARSGDGSTVGLWQLSRPAAKNYGLRMSGSVDERTDPVRSTVAAARFLASLYDTFGDWYLAAAAYNSGPARVQKAVDAMGESSPPNVDTLDVFSLTSRGYVCDITREFVAKFGALVIITKDLEKYGFSEPAYDPEPFISSKLDAYPSPSKREKVRSRNARTSQGGSSHSKGKVPELNKTPAAKKPVAKAELKQKMSPTKKLQSKEKRSEKSRK